MIKLIKKAREVTKYCYAPYSNYHVGASLLFQDGSIVSGVNIENASYGVTNCAERSALYSAISQGKNLKDVVAVAVVADGEKLGSPCGICRQAMAEFLAPTTPVYIALMTGDQFRTSSVSELLPFAFTKADLHG
jgi:cytidine deaminase